MSSRYLHFTLPPGQHTWAVNHAGRLISGHIVNGVKLPYDDVKDADGYVLRGQAEIVELEKAPPAPATGAAAPEKR